MLAGYGLLHSVAMIRSAEADAVSSHCVSAGSVLQELITCACKFCTAHAGCVLYANEVAHASTSASCSGAEAA
ncbi:hypothetical protein COO60DRAFT_1536414, partial [Scenedesmus sp. NREL 46B-D3]